MLVYLSVRFCDIQLRDALNQVPKLLVCKTSLKAMLVKSLPDHSGASESMNIEIAIVVG